MEKETVIKVENLGKKYKIGEKERYLALRDSIVNAIKLPYKILTGKTSLKKPDFWALENVSFEIKRGEVVGIIGRNGAGKTTLLKILSRITEPTTGKVTLKGRVASLLEVGTGFHPELTGRENVYLNGAILGMRRIEINRKFDEIVDFSGVEKFIDTPVKRYSSGMYVRLAFAVAAHLEPEILLVDEVLAVGDAEFQKKCLGKMKDVASAGRTVLFVSHNMGAVSELCTRAMLLHQGQQLAEGEVADVLEAYSQLNNKNASQVDLSVNLSLPCSIVDLKLYNEDGLETNSFDIGEDIIISITYRVTRKMDRLTVVITLARNMVDVFHSYDADNAAEIPSRELGLYEARCTIPKMFLKAGIYSVTIHTTTTMREGTLQKIESALRFEVEEISVNTHMKGYRRDRPGHVISPGIWQTKKVK